MHVCQHGTVGQLDQTLLKPTAGFILQVSNQVSLKGTVKRRPNHVDLQRVFAGQYSDQGLLVSAEALHGPAQCLRIRIGVPLNDLRSTVS